MNTYRGKSFFIDKEGNLIEIDDEVTTEEFAEEYSIKLHIDLMRIYSKIQEIKPIYKDVETSYKDLVVNILGYSLFEYNSKGINMQIPDRNLNYQEVTSSQLQALNNLIEINKESKFLIYNLLMKNNKYEETKIIENAKKLVLTK